MRSREVWAPLLVAFLWSALLIPAAIYLPIGDPANLERRVNGRNFSTFVPLVRINGFGILWLVAVPLCGVLLVGLCLFLHDRLRTSGFAVIALVITLVVLLGALIGTVTFLIGLWVTPTGIFLLIAVNQFRRASTLTRSSSKRVGPCGHPVTARAHFCTTCGERCGELSPE